MWAEEGRHTRSRRLLGRPCRRRGGRDGLDDNVAGRCDSLGRDCRGVLGCHESREEERGEGEEEAHFGGGNMGIINLVVILR